jgi:hypothetical protein
MARAARYGSADAVYRRGPSRGQLEEPGYVLRGKSGDASAAEIEKEPGQLNILQRIVPA